jgi:hypothetical protein
MIARKLVPPIVALGAGCMIALAWEGSGQGKEKQDRQKKIPPGAYYSSGSCYECHNKPQSYQDKFIPNICRCNEFEIWETTDKHRLAFLALKGKRADMMRERLGYDVRAAKACVSCHSVWIEDNQVREKQQSLVEEGVSCFVCHGPDSGTDKRWMDTHGSTNPATRDEWRKESRETKQTRYGMRDLWNPAERSRLCVSCHIGNADEDKIVTHEMYAAGHPPLPSFDMSNFSEAMKHWQALGEKSPAVLKEFKYSPLEVEREQLDLVTIGSLVSFQQTMVLLKKQASKLDAWPEFAQFDCYACHHDLKNPSWRQQRGYRGKPGRPQMSAWPTALMEVAVEYASGADAKAAKRNFKDFEAKLAKLQDAFNAQPFGDTAKIADATDELVQFIEKQIKVLQALPVVDESVHRRLLMKLIEKQNPTYLDHESARQVAGAFRAIYTDGWKNAKRDNEVMSHLTTLDDELCLTFKSGARKKFDAVRFGITKELAKQRKENPADINNFLDLKSGLLQNNYTAELNAHLEKINEYDPTKFKEKMNNIAKLLFKKEQP